MKKKSTHVRIILWVLVLYWIACSFHFMSLRFHLMHFCWPNGAPLKKQSHENESRDSHWHHCEMSISMKFAVLPANYKPHTDWNANGSVVWNHQTFIGYDSKDIIVISYWFCNLSMMRSSHVTLIESFSFFTPVLSHRRSQYDELMSIKWNCVYTKKAIQVAMYK